MHLECEDSSAERERDGAGEYDRPRVERDALDEPERNTYVKRQQISATRGRLVHEVRRQAHQNAVELPSNLCNASLGVCFSSGLRGPQ